MFFLYSVITALLITALGYPFFKAYQLSGYVIKGFTRDMFSCFKTKGKNRLVFTKRMTRFLLVYFLVLLAIYIPIYLYITQIWLIFVDILIGIVIEPLIVIIVHMLICPIEEWIKKTYIAKTKKKLKNFTGIKVGITGSFGKTSTKNILKHILEGSFEVVASPKNYNTPMGVCKTAQKINVGVDVAIFEMGARKRGDIKELMNIVEPQYCIMTAIGEQHLETMGTLNGVKKIKNEMCENISKKASIIFDTQSEPTLELFGEHFGKKIGVGREGDFCYASELYIDGILTSFWLHIDGKKIRVKTKLLGSFNVENILLASSLAYILGVGIREIAHKIGTLIPTKNRLELIDGDIKILDDSYNSNIIGSAEALSIAHKIGRRAIVVTPGFVELGRLQYEKNFLFGKKISSFADIVVIMNLTNKKALLDGLKVGDFKGEIYHVNTREEQTELLHRIVQIGDCVLFENDLPDNYK